MREIRGESKRGSRREEKRESRSNKEHTTKRLKSQMDERILHLEHRCAQLELDNEALRERCRTLERGCDKQMQNEMEETRERLKAAFEAMARRPRPRPYSFGNPFQFPQRDSRMEALRRRGAREEQERRRRGRTLTAKYYV